MDGKGTFFTVRALFWTVRVLFWTVRALFWTEKGGFHNKLNLGSSIMNG